MLLKKDCVIKIFAKYKITISKNGSMDGTILYFEFYKPYYKIFSLQVRGNNVLYDNLATMNLINICKKGEIDFQDLDTALKTCI